MNGIDRMIDINPTLHIREWPGHKTPFVLVHGLASNCRTWEAVANYLAGQGHRVVTVDQRGHGQSDKPDDGYDFATITADLHRLLGVLEIEQPIMAGQSWGGNVMLEFGARYPNVAHGLAFIDGGFFDLRSRANASWERIAVELHPPDLTGTPRDLMKQRMQEVHPDWSEEGIEGMLANFETLPDGTIRPHLTLDRHLKILRAMWEQTPLALFPRVEAPVLICVASDPKHLDWTRSKAEQVNRAQQYLPLAEVHWFDNTDHDIHIQKPATLAELFLETLNSGMWASEI